jgi:hypothetical protein
MQLSSDWVRRSSIVGCSLAQEGAAELKRVQCSSLRCNFWGSSEAAMGGRARSTSLGVAMSPKRQRTGAHARPKPTSGYISLYRKRTDLPQKWPFADLRFADPIFLVVCGLKTSASPQIHTFLLTNIACIKL